MVATPWGDSDKLRERQLSPGPGATAEAVAENQRQRIYGAMVASVADRGYDATRLSDLSEISGVSSRSFYKLFPGGKEECFLALLKEILKGTDAVLSAEEASEAEWPQRLQGILERFAGIVAAQPAAASLALTEAYAAAPTAAQELDRVVAAFERLSRRLLKESPEREGVPMTLVQAQVGALQELARTRLRHGEADALMPIVPQFVELISGYRAPPRPLRLSTRTPAFDPEGGLAPDDAERAIRGFTLAVAEHGYAGATIHEIARLGSMSPTTFSATFGDKRQALLAAVDSSTAQLSALALAAYRRSPCWAEGVRAALGSALTFLASRPATANLLLVEVYAGGPEALGVRARGVREVTRLFDEGRVDNPGVPPIAAEVISGGIAALARRQILSKGAESLPSLAPIATYIALAPFIGPEEACTAANSDGRPRASGGAKARQTYLQTRQTKWTLQAMLGGRSANAEELAAEIGRPVARVREMLKELEKDEQVERIASLDDTEPEGTVGRRFDEHHTRLTLELDEEGWSEMAEIHRAAFKASLAVKAKSERRAREAGSTRIVGRSVQYLFEFPQADTT